MVASSERVRIGTAMALRVAALSNVTIWSRYRVDGGCIGPTVSLLMASADRWWSQVPQGCG